MDIVSIILEDQPSHIRDKTIDQEIFDALKNGQQSKGLYDVINSNHISLDVIEFNPEKELEQAIQTGRLERLLWLLALDPELSFAILEGMEIDYRKFDKKLRFEKMKHVPTLIERQFDFTQLNQIVTR